MPLEPHPTDPKKLIFRKQPLPWDSMHLRDYFAAQAMQGFIAYATHKGIYAPPDEELAKVSYQLADAMLKARGQE